MRTILLSTFLAGAMWAQVSGPLIGYVPDGPRIRPMRGLPGSGAIGSAFSSSREFSHIAISPQQNFAVATAADTGELLVVTPGVSQTTVSGAAANPDMLILSPGGTSAALWFPLNGHLQIVSGLPAAPSVRTIDASFLNASPLALAVTDDGQWSAGLFSAGVYAFGPNAEVLPLQADPGVVALSFFHNKHDLAMATSARATSITDVGGANQGPSVLYDYSAQPLSPRAIGVSFDNQRVIVADSGGTLLNIVSGNANLVQCGCFPTTLSGLGGSLFRLNGISQKSELKLFDASSGAVLIVPPALAEMGARQ